jgi:hypothetical protein
MAKFLVFLNRLNGYCTVAIWTPDQWYKPIAGREAQNAASATTGNG